MSGSKTEVYKMLKIMKLCCKADIESYKMKYAIERGLGGRKYEEASVGFSLRRVLRYWTLRGKFYGVHPDLEKFGVKKIQVDMEGLTFIFV